MRVIKLMADYHCFPLWEASPGKAGNVNPQDLPISPALRDALIVWAKKYTATSNIDDPKSSGFDSEEKIEEFRNEGDDLAQRLQDELGVTYHITNYSVVGVARRLD